MATWLNRLSGASKLITVVVVLALVVGLVLVLGQQDGKRYLTAQFQQSNSLYEGSDVKILGVPVGTVDSITPQGETVRVKIAYDGDVRLPRDVKAVIVSPSVVGDRYVQLTPAYDGGASLADNAAIGVNRTAVPVELDQVYSSLDDLSSALGPEGANKNGALSDLVSDSAAQLDGQGAQVNETIKNFGKLSTTLSNNKDELFGSVREVNDFVQLLNRNDDDVRDFFDSTAQVSQVLEGEREDLKATLEQLGKALIDVRTLVRENRGELRSNVKNLTTVADVLGRNQKNIDGFSVNAPTALSNVALTYNGQFGSLDNRADILDLLLGAGANIGTIACDTIGQYLPDNGVGNPLIEACKAAGGTLGGVLGPILGGLGGVLTPRTAAASDPQTTGDPQRTLDDMLAVK